jgi:hypothetical protein
MKTAKLKEDLAWAKQAQDVLRMVMEANAARKKTLNKKVAELNELVTHA